MVTMTSWMWDHRVIRETDTNDLALVNEKARVDNETVVWEKNRTPCICVCTQVVTKWWNFLRSNQVSQTDDDMKWQFNMVSTDPKDIALVFPINEVITILRQISPLNSREELIVRTVSCSFPVSMSKPQLAKRACRSFQRRRAKPWWTCEHALSRSCLAPLHYWLRPIALCVFFFRKVSIGKFAKMSTLPFIFTFTF